MSKIALVAGAGRGEVRGGQYREDCHGAEIIDIEGVRGGVRPYAIDPERANTLWAKSEEMVGERFWRRVERQPYWSP